MDRVSTLMTSSRKIGDSAAPEAPWSCLGPTTGPGEGASEELNRQGEDFIQCYCNRGERLNSTLLKQKVLSELVELVEVYWKTLGWGEEDDQWNVFGTFSYSRVCKWFSL